MIALLWIIAFTGICIFVWGSGEIFQRITGGGNWGLLLWFVFLAGSVAFVHFYIGWGWLEQKI